MFFSTAKLDATGRRWIVGLDNYSFDKHYYLEKSYLKADTLSRIQWNEVITSAAVHAVNVNVT